MSRLLVAKTVAALSMVAILSDVAMAADADPVVKREALSATLWMQDSVEYVATSLQAYQQAAVRLDTLIKNPGTAAVEQAATPSADYAKKPPAIVLDLDETVFDNGLFDGWLVKNGRTFASADEAWLSWIASGKAGLVPGADRLIAEARRLKVRVVFMTNRACDKSAGFNPDGTPASCVQRDGSRADLTRLLGYQPAIADLMFRGDKAGRDDKNKSARRAELSATNRIVALFGDDLEDFVARDRYDSATMSKWWGDRWVILSNPSYGSWENGYWKVDAKYAALKQMDFVGDSSPQSQLRAPKVFIISMFGPEAEPWIAPLKLTQEIRIDGLSPDYPTVRCNADDVCQMTTGMGHTNAAASTMALIASRQFDLTHTWFLIAGIAGIDPHQGTVGSAAWARWLVDFGIAHEIDPREAPKDWKTGYFGVLTKGPGEKPKFDYKTEAFQLDERLLQKALALSRNATLDDSDRARVYRKLYAKAPANQPPRVIQCDTAAGDTWFHGHRLGEHATEWTRLLTDGKGVYCTTQQEDNATMNVLLRGEASGLVDSKRLAVLRTASNFDRPHPGQTAIQSLTSDSGGFGIATANLVKAGKPLVDDIVARWPQWRVGVPND